MIQRFRALAIGLAILCLLATGALAENFTFVHMSDTHITGGGSHVQLVTEMAEEINALQPDFVLISGDLTETGFVGDWERYVETVKAFKVPIYNVLGNHEVKWSHIGKTGLEKYTGFHTRYSFDHGGVHFVGMNSTVWLQHHGQIDSEELIWLKNDLAKAGMRTPSVLFYHHCPGYIPNEAELLRAIRPYNVRLILVGHGHEYKVWQRNGLVFQECENAYRNRGYRIVEVSDSEMRTSTKLVGQPATPENVVSLTRPRNPIRIIEPRYNDKIEGTIHIRAAVTGLADDSTIEYVIDGEASPMTATENGIYEADTTFDGVPGWYTLRVRTTDADGMQWSDSVPVRIDGSAREVWQVSVSGGVQRGIKAAADRIYFGTLAGDLYCLDARSGAVVWREHLGSEIISEVALHNNLAYLGTTDGKVHGINAATGKRIWEFAAQGPVTASPVIYNGKVLIGAGDPAFYALDAKTGKQIWKYEMKRSTQAIPLVVNDTVLFGAWDANFHGLDVNTGQPKWKTPIGTSFYFSAANADPVTDGKRIGVKAVAHNAEAPDIFCLDPGSGEILWSKHNSGKSDCGFNSPGTDGKRLYCLSGNGEVFCMSFADGSEIWKSSIRAGITSGKPAFADGKLYVAGLHGKIACMDASNGKVLWNYSAGSGYMFGGSTVWRDLLIIPSMNGTVTAIRR